MNASITFDNSFDYDAVAMPKHRYCVEQPPFVAVYAMLNVSHCVCDLARMPVTVPLAMIDMHRRVYA